MAGFPIWYELMSSDPAGCGDFYRKVLGWMVPPSGDVMPNGSEYATILRSDGGAAGGLLKLSPQMLENGARSGWVVYFDVADVDASVEQAKSLGANVHMEPTTMPGAGRLAMLSDPQGAHFYLITPTPPADKPDAQSDVFKPDAVGHCSWNELNTSGAPEQEAFYTALFDWTEAGAMPMPGDHSYKFYNHGEIGVGAIGSMKPEGMANGWLPYFRVADIDAAKAAVEANSGTILMGPHEVPGDDMIMVVFDPAGAALGLVGRKG